MSDEDFKLVSSEIENEKFNLNFLSQEIWKNPELAYNEVHAHDILTSALLKYGFAVEKNYVKPTGFKAKYSSKKGKNPVLAVPLEYDALPEIGHACGHNLIAEAGLATTLGIKAAMEADPNLAGTENFHSEGFKSMEAAHRYISQQEEATPVDIFDLSKLRAIASPKRAKREKQLSIKDFLKNNKMILVFGTPAEELYGGKLDFIKAGAFDDVDAAIMAHPSPYNITAPSILSVVQVNVDFKGKESHAAAAPWEGCNALDAAVAAYQNIALLRQQIKPTNRINAIITKGGVVANVIPAESRLEMFVRAVTKTELHSLLPRVTNCINSGALAAGCTASIEVDDRHSYENLISNEIMANLYDSYSKKLGIHPTVFQQGSIPPSASTDMGNVSHVVPSIHPLFSIGTKAPNHTKEFRNASGDSGAQIPTLAVAKALAMTALALMRYPEVLEDVKKKFESDIEHGL